jgi:hypothetical protein
MVLNLEQICRLAAYQAAEVRQAGTLGPALPIAVLRSWANDANMEAEKLIRQVREDYFTKVMASTTATATKIRGVDYTPSTSLVMSTTSNRITLPPDFLTLKSIRCITAGYEGTHFEHLDLAHPEFQAQLKSTGTYSGAGGFFYDIIGDRTLWFVPSLSANLDIEIVYVARTAQLHYYATGTIAVTNATVAVAGTTVAWLVPKNFDDGYLDIVMGASGVATIPTPDPAAVYDGIVRSRVLSIDTDDDLTLASAKSGTLAAGTGYYLSSIPQLPEEAHYGLVDFVTCRILATLGAMPRADWFMARFKDRVGGIVTSAARRQIADNETVEDFNPGDG